MFYNLSDIPVRIVDLSEDIFSCEERFQDFLLSEGVRDTRYITEAKWDSVYKALEEKKARLEEEDDEY